MNKIFLAVFVFVLNSLNAQQLKHSERFGLTDPYDAGVATTRDRFGNIWVAAEFGAWNGGSNVTIGPQTYNLNMGRSLTLIRYNSEGQMTFVKPLKAAVTGDRNTWARDIACDDSGNVYVVFTYRNADIKYDNMEVSAGGGGIGLMKIDSAGKPVWSRTITTNETFMSLSTLQVSNANKLYLFFSTDRNVYFPSGDSVALQGKSNLVMLRYDLNGNREWAKRLSSGGTVRAVAVKCHNDLIYACGTFSDTVSFLETPAIVAGALNTFILRMDSALNLQWKRGASMQYPMDIETDDSGNVYVSGNSNGSAELFKMSYSGQLRWFVSSTEGNGPAILSSIKVLKNYIYGNGYYFSAIRFGSELYTSGNNLATGMLTRFTINGQFLGATRVLSWGNDEPLAFTADTIGRLYSTGRVGSISAGYDYFFAYHFDRTLGVPQASPKLFQWYRDNGLIRIQLLHPGSEITLLNLSGQTLCNFISHELNTQISEPVIPGIYFLIVKSPAGIYQTEKVFID